MTPTERVRCEFYTTGCHNPSECKHYYPDLDPFQCGRCGLFLPFEFPLCAADKLKIGAPDCDDHDVSGLTDE